VTSKSGFTPFLPENVRVNQEHTLSEESPPKINTGKGKPTMDGTPEKAEVHLICGWHLR
jgi:hypothetical protein